MATIYSRSELFNLIAENGFMPLFNTDDEEQGLQVLEAAYRGGVRVFEFTNRSPKALVVFKKLSLHAASAFPDLVLGAGTITDPGMAASFLEAGARFIVLPMIRPRVAEYCQKQDVFWMPGCGTISEIAESTDQGADMVKIFPAELLGGYRFLEAIHGPCPWVRAMPTGGVDGTDENLRAWFGAGAVCVGMGSRLFTREIMAARNYELLEKNISRITTMIRKIRQGQ
ncbi:MAG TPA: hypothetical protein VNE41_09815 [Chitinophagaceae bacterium]|nr:hypothetical protein [Chitinophagaceae bacterium]